eukprot:1188912-Prorocentrum_minimum.AAC.3
MREWGRVLAALACCRPRRRRGYILTTEQSDAGGAGIFPRRTNQKQAARVYSHDGPITMGTHRHRRARCS